MYKASLTALLVFSFFKTILTCFKSTTYVSIKNITKIFHRPIKILKYLKLCKNSRIFSPENKQKIIQALNNFSLSLYWITIYQYLIYYTNVFKHWIVSKKSPNFANTLYGWHIYVELFHCQIQTVCSKQHEYAKVLTMALLDYLVKFGLTK